MEAARLIDRLRDSFPDAVIESDVEAIDPYVKVAPATLTDVAAFLRDDPEMSFDFLMAVTGMDLMGLEEGVDDLRVEYHFYSYKHRHTIVIRVDLPREGPVVPSLAGLYPTADWNEREAWDLLGIRFDGHPDLRRILLPEEWEGHPLRKDWKEGPTALGFETTRGSFLDLIRDSKQL
ncbi:MAG: NADH-quinone oxidoreductase subunit C [Deltaproteobacteria bacterium]|nr:NADH-quinone oxidoreductase subunit C [Deltaproteobacteria bacterium]